MLKCRDAGSSSAKPRRSHPSIVPKHRFCYSCSPLVDQRTTRSPTCLGACLPLDGQALSVAGCPRSTVDGLEQAQREDHHGVQCTARQVELRDLPQSDRFLLLISDLSPGSRYLDREPAWLCFLDPLLYRTVRYCMAVISYHARHGRFFAPCLGCALILVSCLPPSVLCLPSSSEHP